MTKLHWVGYGHCIRRIGCRELIQAGVSLSACLLLLLLTNLRGKIGIQLMWPEELSPSLLFVIQSLGPCSNLLYWSHPYSVSYLLLSSFLPISGRISLQLVLLPRLRGKNSIQLLEPYRSYVLFTILPHIFALHLIVTLISFLSSLHFPPHMSSTLLLPALSNSVNPYRWRDRVRAEKKEE